LSLAPRDRPSLQFSPSQSVLLVDPCTAASLVWKFDGQIPLKHKLPTPSPRTRQHQIHHLFRYSNISPNCTRHGFGSTFLIPLIYFYFVSINT
jgi:hypothetical protein